MEMVSLNVFVLEENSFRFKCLSLVNWTPFKIFIQLMIVLSSMALCFLDFVDADNKTQRNKNMVLV